jgi:hypothetical protein
MTIHVKRKFILAIILVVAVLCLGAQVAFAVVLSSDTNVYLSGSNITLTLAAGSNLTSYSVDTATLTLDLASGSSVTVKSNDLYTLTNSLSQPTLCSASPAYSYVTFTAGSTETVTVTPSTTVACSGTAPVIGSFGASPSAITSGQSSTLSWSLSGASTVSIDNGVGSQSSATTSSVSVSPAQTTTYTLTAVNYIGTTTAQTTVTVTAPASYIGGGGGGGTVSLPTIDTFSASPAIIQAGQSSLLSWNVTGAATVTISPSITALSLNPNSDTATITPATTTTYTLSAANGYNQSVTAVTTVTVYATTALSPAPTPSPPVLAEPATSTPSSGPAYCLVNHSGTFFLILNGVRHGIANPGLLYSFGYGFGDAVADAATYQTLQSGNMLGPNDGALVKSPSDPTVFLVSGQSKHGFTSATVFSGLGYKFTSVLTIPAPQMDALPLGDTISSSTASHLPGTNISSQGTVYLITGKGRQPYPSLAVYNSWNLHNDLSRIVPANAVDLSLPIGPALTNRSSCDT